MTSIPTLIKNTINFLELDLTGLTIVTEAASGSYAVTPIIALMANAKKVIGLTSNSHYASIDEVILQTRALEKLCNLSTFTEIRSDKSPDIFSQADIITNLGFVRPIDNKIISSLQSTTVISAMCEGWEVRTTDIDLIACKQKNIPVLGVNETYPLDILSYCGWLCIYMMVQAGINIPNATILIISQDKFGQIIKNHLIKTGLTVKFSKSLKTTSDDILSKCDVIIIADYINNNEIIGSNGDISPLKLNQINPSVSIIQFAGMNNLQEILNYNINIYPKINLQPHKMGLTLSKLGPQPVIELHSLGLKVGEALAKARKYKHLDVNKTIHYAMINSPGDLIHD